MIHKPCYRIIVFILFVLFPLTSLISRDNDIGNTNGKFIKIKLNEKVLKKLDELQDTFSVEIKSGHAKTGIRSIDRLSRRYDAISFKRIFPNAGEFEKRHEKYG